jgi:hypothetical protein
MSSLWTPSGERPVERQPQTEGPSPEYPTALTEDEAAAQVAQLRRQLIEAGPEVVIANHCYGLFELATVYLSEAPPLLGPAQLVIDSLGYLVEGLGPRLGEPAAPLREALAQLRLAFVQLANLDQVSSAADGTSEDEGMSATS